MTPHLPLLIPLVLLVAALLAPLVGIVRYTWVYRLALVAVAVDAGVALWGLAEVVDGGTMTYRLAGWQPPIGIEGRLVENRALANRKHSSQFGFKRTSPFEANLGDPFRTSSSNRYGDLICQLSETLEQFAITARCQNEGSR